MAADQRTSVCSTCHPKIVQTYLQTGMAKSFYPASKQNMAEEVSKSVTYFHKPSETYFAMLEHDGKYFQRGYQIDASGKQVNVTEKRIDYVMGSGNHARTYLHRTDADTLTELPLGWYAEKGGYWAMNPGYDRANHDGFRRPITYDCMFCHNAYPKIPPAHERPFSEPVYEGPLPDGIDCQRCHGPGDRHVKLAGTRGVKLEQVRAAIVNPARLSAQRQMEGCMVCHLESTSFPLPNALQRFERSSFSYRAGEALAGFILNFDHASGSGREEKFEIVSAAYRLRRSACFLKSEGKMRCTTCHDPHNIPRGEEAARHYTAVCLECHSQSLDKLAAAGKHTQASDCVGCHMPKRRTEDVVHVAVTDHFIQRQNPGVDLLAELSERQDPYRGRVALYYPETVPKTAGNDLTVAVAQVIQGSNLTAGIVELSDAIRRFKPTRAEYYLQLADALRNNGQQDKALPLYRQAVRHDPTFAFGLQKLGTALRQSGQYQEATNVLKKAALAGPDSAVTWHELGRSYQAQGKIDEAVTALQKALALNPDLPEAHNNIAVVWMAQGQQSRAEAAFRDAIRTRLDYADAHGNLAGLLSAEGRTPEAQKEFEIALRLRPADSVTRYRYAVMLGKANRLAEAQRELEEALRSEPALADAHLLLGDLLMAKQQAKDAEPHYRQALRAMPDSGRVYLGLGAALVASGDLASGIEYLKKAAASQDPPIRDQASEILKQLHAIK